MRRSLSFLAIYVVVLGLFSLCVPVTVTERLTGAIDSEAGPFTHQDSVFVGIALFRAYPRVVFQDSDPAGTITDEEYVSFDRGRYMVRAGVIAAILAFLFFEWGRGLRRAAHWGCTVLLTQTKHILLWVPLIVYAAAALWRMVFVPCAWLVTVSLRMHLTTQTSGTIPLWEIGTEDIRYGLILFEESVMLACVAGWYGAAYALSPRMRSTISGVLNRFH